MTIYHENPAWPYLAFAEQLNADIAKHAKIKALFVSNTGIPQATRVKDPMQLAKQLMDASETIMQRLESTLSATRVVAAFGNAEHPSNEALIRQIADDMITKIYAELITWANMCLGFQVSEQFVPMFKALANLMSRPIRQFEDFAADVTQRANTIDADIRAGRTPSVNFSLSITPTIDDQDMRMYRESVDFAQQYKAPRRGLFRRG